MRLETFTGPDLRSVVAQVRQDLGDDAMIVRTGSRKAAGREIMEVVAAPAHEIEAFRHRLEGERNAFPRARTGRARIGPYVVALVGPTGAGKTSTAMKMALHPRALGRRKVGLVTLDTFRPGAVEELQTYAEIADLPLEVLYHHQDLEGAFQRLRDCEAIIVDTPGRAPGADLDGSEWKKILETMDPDEVHLVVPAGLRIDVAIRIRGTLASLAPTHALYTKLDEMGGDEGLAELAEAMGLPVRWISDGQEIPVRLHPAAPRILGSLGLGSQDDTTLGARAS